MKVLICVLIWVLGLTEVTNAQNRDTDHLKGIKAFSVQVIFETDDAKEMASESTLQNYVELRLRDVGLAIVPASGEGASDWIANDGKAPPFLRVVIMGLELLNVAGETRGYCCTVALVLDQLAVVIQNDMYAHGSTWRDSQILAHGDKYELRRAVKDVTEDLMDKFLNDFYKANPADE